MSSPNYEIYKRGGGGVRYIECFAAGTVQGTGMFTSAVVDEITTGAPELHSKQKTN